VVVLKRPLEALAASRRPSEAAAGAAVVLAVLAGITVVLVPLAGVATVLLSAGARVPVVFCNSDSAAACEVEVLALAVLSDVVVVVSAAVVVVGGRVVVVVTTTVLVVLLSCEGEPEVDVVEEQLLRHITMVFQQVRPKPL
jgi:hypothetical protein